MQNTLKSPRTWDDSMVRRFRKRPEFAVRMLNSCSESEFLPGAGEMAVGQTLADRQQFVLDEAQWLAFQEALDRPAQHKTRLEKLLREPGVLG